MKSILVHLDASPRAAVRLALAQRLASLHGAELTALYGVVPAMLAAPWTAGEGMATAASWLAELDREQRERARATFEKAAAQGAMRWLDGGSALNWSVQQHALYADLVVLGQTDPGDSLTGALPPDFVAASVSDSGKPSLVVPFAGLFEAQARQVLIAWKPTREAARAVSAALPWLRLATQVHIATRPDDDEADTDPAARLAHWLQVQGIEAPVQTHRLGSGDIGEALLSLAADISAELLVMGCYGHSRAREWVLGGASRDILRSMTLPVLMVH